MSDASGASRKKSLPAWLIVVATLVLLGVVVWRLDQALTTDDAYVYADTINVVPEVTGKIVEMPVRDNQPVKRGDLLFRIDPRPYQDALNQARARLVTLERQIGLTQRTVNAQQYNADSVKAAVERSRAQAVQAADTLHRMEPLLAPGYMSAEDVDRARTAERAAQAELNAAMLQAQQASAAVSGVDALVAQRAEVEAQIAIAELNLEFTEVRAPFDGRVASLRTTVGQFASALKPVFTLIDIRHWYVIANFRETDLKGVRAGTSATVYLLSDTGKHFDGEVDSISYGVLPDDGGVVQEGLPRVARSINWVHVSQRFPVKIAVRNPNPETFRIGTSAVATLRRDASARGAAQ
ncbi:multidrug transporter subunit MdtN [Burkholderia lata]|uniref:Secretion protein, HlyD family n=1 Tax=Burkholderia lata (strain ATCC 17760 / DSM 23089 / LMG 22485 / NCIMB 9086 / R18194 / 383) TaxID=482957 RepID=Q39PL1_BURL3|nr:multidrug transporter subunit MdtN [Burkholderia lata]ABB05605.1 Secretion protein, HlyD family [Burkholderia lata]